jgi:hypothetical protein
MLHLLKNAVNPELSLKDCLLKWYPISMQLRESPRKRLLQTEFFEKAASRALP